MSLNFADRVARVLRFPASAGTLRDGAKFNVVCCVDRPLRRTEDAPAVTDDGAGDGAFLPPRAREVVADVVAVVCRDRLARLAWLEDL